LYRHANGLFGLAVSLSGGMYVPLSSEGWNIYASGPGKDSDVSGDGPDVQLLAGYASVGVRFGGGIIEGK